MATLNRSTTTSHGAILAIDVGSARIGLALARPITKIPKPYGTLDATKDVKSVLAKIISNESVMQVVVGLPRGLDGQETSQTTEARAFAGKYLPNGSAIYYQDEALTSRKAETELKQRGKPYTKGDIDALAATYILEDFMKDLSHETRSLI